MWQMPQHDLPGREPLPDAALYARRERVFLAVASLFVVAAAVLPLLGFGRIYGASWIVRAFGYEPNVALVIPLGVLALPIAILALNVAGALYGKTRTRALVIVTSLVWGGVLGLLSATDHLPAYDNTTTHGFPLGLALVASALPMFVVQLELFALTRRWLRHVLPVVFALAAGIGVFALLGPRAGVPRDLGMLVGTAGYVLVTTWLGAIVLAPIVGMLARHLRVALRLATRNDDPGSSEPSFVVPRKQRAMIVDTPVPGTLRTTAPAVRKRPFTTEEIAFFDAGENP